MASPTLNMGITAYPVDPPLPKPPEVVVEPSDIDPKLLAIMKKYKYNWRLNKLSKLPEFKRVNKYVKKPQEMIKATPKREVILEPDIEFRCDHLSRTPLRYLIQNRRLHNARGKRFRQAMKKHIAKSWHSIYNYYKFQQYQRARTRRLMRPTTTGKAKKSKSRKSVEKERQERVAKLAQPKKLFEPPPGPPIQIRAIEEMKEHLDSLAQPKERRVPKERALGVVRKDALTYEITPEILKLATTIPKRYREKIPVIIPGKVKRGALRAKMTERLDALSQPKVRREQKQAVDDGDDPWVISPNALKYKATARILELAKPKERE